MSLSPAYHLRTNKAIERLLFIELLRKVDGHLPQNIDGYRYVSLGGPYLDDFALIHGTFGNRRMLSLEVKPHVRSRQVINRPYSRITLSLDSTEAFVGKYSTGNIPLIVWFDYEWQDWKQQLEESCDLLPKLPPMSIFKITLTGRTEWLGGQGERYPMLARAEKLSEVFGDYGRFSHRQIDEDSVCGTLYYICRRAIGDAVPDSQQKCVRTLAAYEYNDGTPVLTITMVVGALSAIKKLVETAGLTKWRFAVLNWREPKRIAVPFLGLRERLAVDRLMPDADPRTVVKRLRLRLSADYRESVEAIANYIEFYQHVPQFLRVTV
jgi:hypothetical protein